jgi:hypothetical protein
MYEETKLRNIMEHEIKNDGRTNMRIKISPGMLRI